MSVPGKTAIAGLLTGPTAIGLASIFFRLSETGSTATAFWRVTLVVPFLWVWMRLEGRRGTSKWALLLARHFSRGRSGGLARVHSLDECGECDIACECRAGFRGVRGLVGIWRDAERHARRRRAHCSGCHLSGVAG